MANVGTVRSASQLFTDSLLTNTAPTVLRYYSRVVGDASPAAAEIFINGEENSRFYLPTNSVVIARLMATAWNVTDGDNPAMAIVEAAVENDGGTVAITPVNLSGTDGNPIVVRTGGFGTITMAADNTNKALIVNFTPVANKTYQFSAVLHYSFAAAGLRNSNYRSVSV